jgi:hypothetical protein
MLATGALSVLSLTVMFPFEPDVPETMLSREPVASVSTLALMPAPDELMADANPASELSLESQAARGGRLPMHRNLRRRPKPDAQNGSLATTQLPAP